MSDQVTDDDVILFWLTLFSAYTTLLTITVICVIFYLRKRRSSILKSQRPARTPFSELEFNVATPTDTAKSRRVSFARRTGVAEFVTNEATTTWKNFYEEHNKSMESSGNDSDANVSRQPVEHLGKRIFDQQFEDVEGVGLCLNPLNSSTSINHVDFMNQIASLDATSSGKICDPKNTLEISSLTDHQSKLFGNDFTVALGETSGRIDVNFSALQRVGDDLDEYATDSERAVNVVCHGPSDVHNISEYIEVDLDMTHVDKNDCDMSITDTIGVPKVQDVSKNVSIDKKNSANDDWVKDKENIAINPYVTPKESNNFAVNEEPSQVLVFDGKRLTLQPERVDDCRQTVLPTESSQQPQRKRIVLNMDDDLPNFSEYSSNSEVICKTSSIDLEFYMPVNKVDIVPRKSSSKYVNTEITGMKPVAAVHHSGVIQTTDSIDYQEEEIDNVSLTQGVSANISEPNSTDKRKTIVFGNDTGNISITEALPSNIINKKINEKRQTIVFDGDQNNISLTQAIPAAILEQDSQEKRRTIVFGDGKDNVSFTQTIPASILEENSGKLKTILYNDSIDNISMTQAIPGAILEQKTSDKRTTIVFDDDQNNISITRAISANVILDQNQQCKTMCDQSVDDVSFTQAIPAPILDQKPLENRKTIVFDDGRDNISFTQAIPASILEQKLPEKRKTIVFDNDSGNISITRSLPANIILFNKVDEKQRTIIYEDATGNISITQAATSKPIMSNDAVLQRRTIVYEEDTGNISVTHMHPPNTASVKSDSKSDSSPSDDLSDGDVLSGHHKRTVVYEDGTGKISIKRAIQSQLIFDTSDSSGVFTVRKMDEKSSRSQEINTDISIEPAISMCGKSEAHMSHANVFLLSGIAPSCDRFVQTTMGSETEMAIETEITSDVLEPLTEATERRKTVIYKNDTAADMSITEAIPKIENIIKDNLRDEHKNRNMAKPIPLDLIAIQDNLLNKWENKPVDTAGMELPEQGVLVFQAGVGNDKLENKNDGLKTDVSKEKVVNESGQKADGLAKSDTFNIVTKKDGKDVNRSPDSFSEKSKTSVLQTLLDMTENRDKFEFINDLPKILSKITAKQEAESDDRKVPQKSTIDIDDKRTSPSASKSSKKTKDSSKKSHESHKKSQESSKKSKNSKSFKSANDTQELLDMISDFTDRSRSDSKPDENDIGKPAKSSEKPVSRRLSTAPDRKSIISREDLLSNISMAQAALQKSRIELNDSLSTDDTSPEEGTSILKKSGRSSSNAEVVKTLHFDDESISDMSSKRYKLKHSPLKKTIYEPLPKENKKVIPSYLKDVSDGIKELISDLTKPVADVLPYEINGKLPKCASTHSNEIQANLITSSQIDVKTSIASIQETGDTSFWSYNPRSCMVKVDSEPTTSLTESTATSASDLRNLRRLQPFSDLVSSESPQPRSLSPPPRSESPAGRSDSPPPRSASLTPILSKIRPQPSYFESDSDLVLVFDQLNPLNNVLISPIDYSRAHRYNPIDNSKPKVTKGKKVKEASASNSTLRRDVSGAKNTSDAGLRQSSQTKAKNQPVESALPSEDSNLKAIVSKIMSIGSKVSFNLSGTKDQLVSAKSSIHTDVDNQTSTSTVATEKSASCQISIHSSDIGKNDSIITNAEKVKFKSAEPVASDETAKADPEVAKADPEVAKADPEMANADPEEAKADPEEAAPVKVDFDMPEPEIPPPETADPVDPGVCEADRVVAQYHVETNLGMQGDVFNRLNTVLSSKSTFVDRCTDARPVLVKDIEVNTMVVMRNNKELLESVSSLTLVDEPMSDSGGEFESDKEVDVHAKDVIAVQNTDTHVSDKEAIESDTHIEDTAELKSKKRVYHPATPSKSLTEVNETTPKPTAKMQKISTSPAVHNMEIDTQMTPERDREPQSDNAAMKKDVSSTVVIRKITPNVIPPCNSARSIQCADMISKTSLVTKPTSLELISSFTSSKNLMESIASGSQWSLTKAQTVSVASIEWHPDLDNPSTSRMRVDNECEYSSGLNIISKIDMLPFMGTHDCEWESLSAHTWIFRLLHGRLRLTIRLRPQDSSGDRVRPNTLVESMFVEVARFDSKNPVATLCVRYASETMRYIVSRALHDPLYARDVPLLLRRCAAITRVALRWGRAMHDAKMHLAYSIDNNGHVSLKVANIPLRTVWEVSVDVELVIDSGRACPWPRATHARVALVVSDVTHVAELHVTDEDVARAIADTPRDWGHAPRCLWRIFRYLKHKTRDEMGVCH